VTFWGKKVYIKKSKGIHHKSARRKLRKEIPSLATEGIKKMERNKEKARHFHR
jgi:hypothetical protein